MRVLPCPFEILILGEMKEYDETAPHVAVRGEWIPMDKVIFQDISEDIQGYDIVTFIYEGKEYQSRVVNKPI
jgi:hypothetical protein